MVRVCYPQNQSRIREEYNRYVVDLVLVPEKYLILHDMVNRIVPVKGQPFHDVADADLPDTPISADLRSNLHFQASTRRLLWLEFSLKICTT